MIILMNGDLVHGIYYVFVYSEYICAASVFADLCGGTCFKTWAAMYYISLGK